MVQVKKLWLADSQTSKKAPTPLYLQIRVDTTKKNVFNHKNFKNRMGLNCFKDSKAVVKIEVHQFMSYVIHEMLISWTKSHILIMTTVFNPYNNL